MTIPVIPECPGAEPAARRAEGAATSPLPWRLDERCGLIHDAAGRCVAVLGDYLLDATPEDLANGRAIVAAINVRRGRHA